MRYTLLYLCIIPTGQYTVSLAVFMYILMMIPAQVVYQRKMNRKWLHLTGFLPHVPLQWFFIELAALERYGECLN